jgi:hypothetical protein
MKKTLFWLSEINVLTWLAIFGHTLTSAGSLSVKIMAGIGLVVGAWMQHRAYYDIYKRKL